MTLRPATVADLQSILPIIENAKATLKRRGVNQWQGGFPAREDILNDINSTRALVLTHEGRVAAFARLNLTPEAEYDCLIRGKWLSQSQNYATVHRVALHPAFRGQGVSDLLLEGCETLAQRAKKLSVRIDTHPDNLAMQRLLSRCGYTQCGAFLLPYPDPSPMRITYEKLIDVK